MNNVCVNIINHTYGKKEEKHERLLRTHTQQEYINIF